MIVEITNSGHVVTLPMCLPATISTDVTDQQLNGDMTDMRASAFTSVQ